MTLKCGQGHELSEGQKFCGECGGPAEEAGKCAACSAVMAKAQRFCSDCGTAAPGTDGAADLDASLDEMNAFVKASTEYEDELLALPEIDDDTAIDDSKITAVLAKARVLDPETQEPLGLDATPVVGELMRMQTRADLGSRAYTEHLTAGMHHLFDGQGKLLKSQVAIATLLKGLAATVAELANTPRGRRSVAIAPAATMGGATRPRTAAQGPAGPDLMAKAVLAARKNGELLSSVDIAKLEGYALDPSLNWGLPEIAAVDPQLAAKVDAALLATAAA
jgi:hypothetical protein